MDVLISQHCHEQFGEILRAAAGGDVRWLRLGPDGVTGADGGAPEVAWMSADIWHRGLIDAFFGVLRQAPELRWVQSAAAGLDGPWFAELRERGVRLSTSHVNDIPIAEYVLAMVLHHYQDHDAWTAARRERAWRYHEFREVYGTCWLVVGVGAIGSRVAERARAFGATVVGVRRRPTGDEPVDRMIGPGDVAAALPEADVVVLALPAQEGGAPLVDGAFLSRMKEGSVLVNVARGSLVDEPALLAALARGVPEHAVLDVFATEPLPAESPLWDEARVTITPHASNGGLARYRRAAELFAANLRRYRAGEPLAHEVPA